jgi:antitoxin MazE
VRVHIRKWGNSLALRIPAAFAREMGIAPGSVVDLTIENGRLTATPPRRPSYGLDDLVEGITEDNRHREIATSDPEGVEAW